MNSKPNFTCNTSNVFNWLLAGLALCLTGPVRGETRPASIPFTDIGARATAGYQGDALSVAATADGARLRCGFQKLEGHATPEGLWLESTKPGGGKLRLVATALGREGSHARECALIEPASFVRSGMSIVTVLQGDQAPLGAPCTHEAASFFDIPLLTELEATFSDVPCYRHAAPNGAIACLRQGAETLARTGGVSTEDKLVRYTRPGLTEEYSVSVDGVRQDFIIESPPLNPPPSAVLLRRTGQPSTLNQSPGDLRLELALSGARAEASASGVRLTFEGSGRMLAYSRLRVEDATGRELAARFEVLSADRLAVSVADANATYPVHIDPTFSDADWVSLNPGLPGANGSVVAMAADGNGNVYVGGGFTFIGKVPANYIAKWDGSAWSALGSGTGGFTPSVIALAVSGTNLYAGGSFTTAGGLWANNIAKWDGSAWSALGSGITGGVSALAVSGTTLYAGGTLWMAGGVTVNNIAKWDGGAWSALGSGIGGISDASVYALAVSGPNLYAGGYFPTAGGVQANGIAKWNGSAWSGLGPQMSSTVYALAVSGTDLYAGGWFTTAGGVPANYIAKWNGSGWSALSSGMDSTVLALAASGGTSLYAGGGFDTAGGVPVNSIAKWNGSAWSALGLGMNDQVDALAVSGTDLYAGGWFTTAAGVMASLIAKWDGSAWSALGSGMGRSDPNCRVAALAVSGTNLYAGGWFTTAGGVPANYIAKWDGSAWSALGSGMSAMVWALAVSGTNLYAGGSFTNAGGMAANRIAKWDGSAWSALGSGMNARVHALAVQGTNLYAGGSFTMAGGVTAYNIAKWDGRAWSALGSGMNEQVIALAVSGTNLYAGGDFNYVSKWDGSTWSAFSSAVGGNYYSPNISALVVSGTNLYAGGTFATAGGVTAYGIATWDGNAWSALGLGLNSEVFALAADGLGHLFVGGYFMVAGTNGSPFIAQANVGSVPAIITPPQSQTAEIGATVDLSVDVGGGYLTYQLLFNGTNLLSCGTDSCLELANINLSQSGTYTVLVTNVFGAVTSAPVMLNVIPAVQRRPVPGVKVSGQTGSVLNVDYADSLSPPSNWATLDSVSLTSTSQYYFDLTLPLPPQRFYRAWQAGTPSVIPFMDLHMIPAITLKGNLGGSVRVDAISQFGPTDAWFTLDTMTLTNTSQLYFDTSAWRQPQRLYRLVPSP